MLLGGVPYHFNDKNKELSGGDFSATAVKQGSATIITFTITGDPVQQQYMFDLAARVVGAEKVERHSYYLNSNNVCSTAPIQNLVDLTYLSVAKV